MPPDASIVSRRRRRGIVLALVAIACGAVAASAVHDRVEEVESRTGWPTTVVVAAREMPEGTKLSRRRIARELTLREVPERYVPRDALSAPEQAAGLELAVTVPMGAYVTAPMLRDPSARAASPVVPVRRGQRLVEVAVTGGRELAATGMP